MSRKTKQGQFLFFYKSLINNWKQLIISWINSAKVYADASSKKRYDKFFIRIMEPWKWKSICEPTDTNKKAAHSFSYEVLKDYHTFQRWLL